MNLQGDYIRQGCNMCHSREPCAHCPTEFVITGNEKKKKNPLDQYHHHSPATMSRTKPSKHKSGDEAQKKSSSKSRRARVNWMARWKKLHSKHHLTDGDIEICNEARLKWKETPQSMRPKLLKAAITQITESYRVARDLEEVDAFVQEKIEKAVRKWIRDRTRSRTKAAKIGTKSYNARRVFYIQNKEEVKARAAELLQETGGSWPIEATAKALTEMYGRLPKEEVDQLQTIANEWNHMGPGEAVQLE